MSQKRAKIGGEVGMNGEFYPAGSFICTTTLAKMGKRSGKGSGKQEVEPYKWEVPPAEGMRSIYRSLNGVSGRVENGVMVERINPVTLAYYGDDRDEVISRIARYNAGERWM